MGQLTEHVSNNYGFAAIIVAFVGRLNPVGIFFASLLMALLYLGGEQAQQYLNLPSSISKVFQGMLLFFLLGADVFVNYRLRWSGREASLPAHEDAGQHLHLHPVRDDRRRHAADHYRAGRAHHREIGRPESRRRRHHGRRRRRRRSRSPTTRQRHGSASLAGMAAGAADVADLRLR